MTLLEIVQTACNELGLVAPSYVAGNSDLQVTQLLALANRAGMELYRDYDWTDLQTTFVVNVAELVETTGDIVNNSAVVTNIPDTSELSDAWAVSGNGQQQAQRVVEVLSSTSVRLQMLSTVTEVGAALTFSKDTYNIPEDFDRYIGNTWWDRTNHWRLIGPDSPQMDEYIRSGIFATGPRRRWRQVGRRPAAWRIWPPPAQAGPPGALVWEYISKYWVVGNDDVTKPKFTADTDEPLLDPQAIILDLKWRMWQIKGFEYAALQQEYLDYIAGLAAADGGIPDLYLNRRAGPFLLSSGNIQDGNWPGPGNTGNS